MVNATSSEEKAIAIQNARLPHNPVSGASRFVIDSPRLARCGSAATRRGSAMTIRPPRSGVINKEIKNHAPPERPRTLATIPTRTASTKYKNITDIFAALLPGANGKRSRSFGGSLFVFTCTRGSKVRAQKSRIKRRLAHVRLESKSGHVQPPSARRLPNVSPKPASVSSSSPACRSERRAQPNMLRIAHVGKKMGEYGREKP
jgi:hypothetical protein